MRMRVLLLAVTASLGVILFQAALNRANAEGQVPAALMGQVTSEEEGPMEGVVVSAKMEGSTITVSVISDKQGHYSFPANRLAPGHYSLRIRAVGYDLDGLGGADVAAQKATTVDLKLRKAKNIVPQLTNAEWLQSIPGTDDQKAYLLNCVGCHTLERIVRSTHDADEFSQVIWRMNGYAQVSQPIKPQRRMDPDWAGKPEQYRKQAEYLATINLSAVSKWEYPLKTLPRPTGRATRVIITEYDLPRPTIEPHDVIVDEHGMAWYSDFGEQFLGRLDPKTGAVKEWPVPELKPGYPVGSLDIEEDRNGDFWLGMMFQGAIAKFDRKTEEFKTYPLPAELNNNQAQLNMLGLQYAVDGKVWTDNAGPQEIERVDLKTGTYERFQPLKGLPGNTMAPGMGRTYSIYGIDSDSHNNLYFSEFQTNYIGRIDAKTGEVKFYQTPTLKSLPRRMQMDPEDRLWFGEYRGNRIGMLDTKTEKFTEWPVPTPWSGPYYVTWDKNGELWTGGMTTDRVVRLDPKTSQAVEYLMPKDTNMRRVFVDNSTTPVTFWTGSNHAASVVKVEPLD
jgi:virginiamycin B lyase